MDENKHREQNKGNIIDLGPALEEKERAERAEAKRLAKESRGPLGRRILSLVLVLAIALAAVLLTINWERINFDALRRSISYWGTEQSETGQTTAFSYEKGNDNCFATLGKNLVYASNRGVVVYDHSGNALFEADVKLDTPALAVGGSAAAAYDIGGRNLVVFSEKGARLRLELDEGLGIYSASLNRSDWLAVTAQKKSQKGCVTVYNADMDKVFEFDSAARFVIGAYVTEDCRYMVAQTLGQEDGVFVSEMVVYRLDQEEQYAEFAVEGGMVYSIGSIGGQTLCIADNQAVLASPGGEVGAVYEYPLPYLREYSCGGDGFAALVLNRHRAGTSAKLVTLDSSGSAIAEADVNDEILHLSAAGRYVAVLYADRLVIYNRDLSEYASFTQTALAEQACMRSDGSVWLISEDEISLLIP